MVGTEEKKLFSSDVCCIKRKIEDKKLRVNDDFEGCGWKSQTRTNGGRTFLVFPSSSSFLFASTDAFLFSISYVLVRKTELFHFPLHILTRRQTTKKKRCRKVSPLSLFPRTTHSTIELSWHQKFPQSNKENEKVPRRKTLLISLCAHIQRERGWCD